jgi:hypothetical protein
VRSRRWTLLLLAWLGCGGRPRPTPLGEDLSRLPHASSASLVDQIPASARFVVALRDPLETWEQLRGSALAGALEAEGLLEDLPALPWIERWEAMRARLGELARKPLPDLGALLHGAAAVAWLPEDGGTEGGWLWVERLGPNAESALEFARVLNAVHPSGADVEIEERKGISLRQVRAGAGFDLRYYVLADRLVVSTDRVLLERSLDLALGGEGSARATFPDVEAAAAAEGFAAGAVGGRPKAAGGGPTAQAREPLLLAGVRRLSLAGHRIAAELDPAIWGPATNAPVALGDELARLDLAGLDLPHAWAAVRPHPAAASPELSVLADLDRLAGVLGRGAWLAAVRDPAGALVPVLGLAAAGPAEEPLERLLADALESVPEDSVEELPGGSLSCPWGDDGPLCVAVCPTRLVLVPRDVALAAGPAICAPAAAAAPGPELALSLHSPAFSAVLPPSPSGALVGAWTAGGASP